MLLSLRGLRARLIKALFQRVRGLESGSILQSQGLYLVIINFQWAQDNHSMPSPWSTFFQGSWKIEILVQAGFTLLLLISPRQLLLPNDHFPRRRYLSLSFWKPLIPASNHGFMGVKSLLLPPALSQTHEVEYHPTIKRNEVLVHDTTPKSLEHTMLSERSPTDHIL